ncbi:hypothetical protein AB0J35_00025 [Nonomuraea angiospora]|uniref:hypothetical protein n=1 Tax=Nonomuraea angiospora TaxID=46172 RepID=UPI00341B3075
MVKEVADYFAELRAISPPEWESAFEAHFASVAPHNPMGPPATAGTEILPSSADT